MYASQYRVMRAGSGMAALDALEQLRQRKDDVALLISDQRMPGLSGIEFLEKAIGVVPDARRVLLTAYADTEVAIRAINMARIHYYLTKPWDPPEEKLYPVLDDLLESWRREYTPRFAGLRVIGHRFSPEHHRIRDFLSRNHVPYRWLDPAAGSEAAEVMKAHNIDDRKLPVVVLDDGTVLVQPEQTELASRVGLRTQASGEFYDLVVVGAGPAGLAAAVYGASEGLRTVVIEGDAPGGQAGCSSKIENYLGFPAGISGADLAHRAHIQATRLGAEFVTQRAVGLRTEGQYHFIKLADGREISGHTVLLAMGINYRLLPAPGMEKLSGRGVYYGAALVEAISCSDEEVYTIGGANSAGQAALHFAKYARKVTMLVRANSLDISMSRYLIDQIAATPNITVAANTVVTEAIGDEHLEAIRISGPEGESVRPTQSLFIFIGAAPKTDWLPAELLRDEHGYLLAGPNLKENWKFNGQTKQPREPFLLETSVPGIFVAGDLRHGSVKRVASAVGEGSIAVQFVHQYLASS